MVDLDPVKQKRAEAMRSHCMGCIHFTGSNHGPWDGYSCGGDVVVVHVWAQEVLNGVFDLKEDWCPERKPREEGVSKEDLVVKTDAEKIKELEAENARLREIIAAGIDWADNARYAALLTEEDIAEILEPAKEPLSFETIEQEEQ